KPGSGKNDTADGDTDPPRQTASRGGAGRRLGHGKRRRTLASKRSESMSNHHRHGLSPRGGNDRKSPGRMGPGRHRLSLYRKRRQPRLSRELRFGGASARCPLFRDRRGGQAFEISHHRQQRRHGGHHKNRPGRGGGLSTGPLL